MPELKIILSAYKHGITETEIYSAMNEIHAGNYRYNKKEDSYETEISPGDRVELAFDYDKNGIPVIRHAMRI